MKTKQVFFFILALGLSLSLAFAAGTPAGTTISNKATGTYYDLNGNLRPQAESNIVITTVATLAGVALEPPTAEADIFDAGTVVFPLVLTNTGNASDIFTVRIKYDADGGAVNSAKIYYDANGNGVLDEGETEMPKQGDYYDTDLLAADAEYKMLVVVTNISGAARSTNLITIEAFDHQYAAEQNFDPVSAEAEYTTKVKRPEIELTMSNESSGPFLPGDEVDILLTAENTGNAWAHSMTFSIPIPEQLSYVPGSIRVFGEQIEDEFDEDGVAISASSNLITINVLFFPDEPGNNYGEFLFSVKVNDNVTAGTLVTNTITWTYENEEGTEQPDAYAEVKFTIGESSGVEVSPDSSAYVTPGDEVFYLVTVKNLGNAGNTFDISYENDMTDWEIYLDANGNGKIDDGEDLITDKNTVGDITLAAFQEVKLIARGEIPADATDTEESDLILTATRQDDDDTSDNSTLSLTVRAPVLNLQKSVSPTGNQPPGTQLTYEVIVKNIGSGIGQDVLIKDSVSVHTDYVAGSLKKDEVSLTDAEDADEGYVEKDGSNKVINVFFSLEEIEPAEACTLSFKVEIK